MAGVAKDQAAPHVHVIFIRLQSNCARFDANFTVIKGNYPFADEKLRFIPLLWQSSVGVPSLTDKTCTESNIIWNIKDLKTLQCWQSFRFRITDDKAKNKTNPKPTAVRISTEVHTKTYFSYHSLILEILRGKNTHSSRPCQQSIRARRQANVTQLEIHSKFKWGTNSIINYLLHSKQDDYSLERSLWFRITHKLSVLWSSREGTLWSCKIRHILWIKQHEALLCFLFFLSSLI